MLVALLVTASTVAACGPLPPEPPGAPTAAAPADPRSAATRDAPPPPRIARMPRRGSWARQIVTPDRVWEWTTENGFTLADSELQAPFAGLFTRAEALDVVLTSDHREAVILFLQSDELYEGYAGPTPHLRVVLERWDLTRRTRRWSRTLAPTFQEAWVHAHLTRSAKGLFVTDCDTHRPGSSYECFVTKVGFEDGTPEAPQRIQGAPFIGYDRVARIEAREGRFTLLKGQHGDDKPAWFRVFDDEGRQRGIVKADCARFDAEDRLWLSGAVPDTLDVLHSVGIQFRSGPAACTAGPMKSPLAQNEGANICPSAISGDRVAWQIVYDDDKAFTLDAGAAVLPSRLAFPAAGAGAPPKTWYLLRSTPDILAVRDKQYVRFGAGEPEVGALPRNGLLWSSGSALLLGFGRGPSRYAFMLGTRSGPGQPPTWRAVGGDASYDPGFAVAERGARKVLTIAGGRTGLQRVDIPSGRLLSRRCDSPLQADGRCSEDTYIGLLPRSDGATAWTYHSVDRGGQMVAATFEEVDLLTGDVVRSLGAPLLYYNSPGEHAMGWLETDRRFWFAGSPLGGTDTDVVQVAVPPAAGGQPTYGGWHIPERPLGIAGDPQGRFLMMCRRLSTVDFYTPGGRQVLLVGARGDDTFALTPDGRFACAGAACEELRCVTGDEARPATDVACQALRAPGFSLTAELARPAARE